MQQPIPMPNLMDRSATLVIMRYRAARHRMPEYVAPVLDIVRTRAAGVDARIRQRAETQHSLCAGGAGHGARRGPGGGCLQICVEVHVERVVGAFAQGGFHGDLVGVAGPGVVDLAGYAFQAVGDLGVFVGVLEKG